MENLAADSIIGAVANGRYELFIFADDRGQLECKAAIHRIIDAFRLIAAQIDIRCQVAS